MVIYKKVINPKDGKPRYIKDKVFVKGDRVPQEVLDKFDFTDEVKFDERPDKERCLFCDGPASRKRLITGLMIAECEPHYYSKTVGAIASYLKERNE